MALNRPNKIQIIKYAPPPPDLPTLGKSDPSEVVFIGRTNYVASLEEKKFVFYLRIRPGLLNDYFLNLLILELCFAKTRNNLLLKTKFILIIM